MMSEKEKTLLAAARRVLAIPHGYNWMNQSLRADWLLAEAVRAYDKLPEPLPPPPQELT